MRDTCYGGENFLFEKFKKKGNVVKTLTCLNTKDNDDEVGSKERNESTLIKDLDTGEYDEKTILASKVSNLMKKRDSLPKQSSSDSDGSSSVKSKINSKGSSRKSSSRFANHIF